MSTSGMVAGRYPDGVCTVVMCCDGDSAKFDRRGALRQAPSRKAANAAAEAIKQSGRNVQIVEAPLGMDFLDVWIRERSRGSVGG